MRRELKLWIPKEASLPLYERLKVMFQSKHPDVDVHIQTYPITIYWDTVKEACLRNEGPDIFFMHNEYAQDFIANNLLQPYQFSAIQKQVLQDLYPATSDQGYYYDFAYLTSLLYVQKGVELHDGMKWEEYMEKLNISNYKYQLGCSINNDTQAAFYMMCELQHQTEGKTKQFLTKLFQNLRVSPINEDCKEQFLKHDIATVYSWGWFAGWLDDHKMDYDVYALCEQDSAQYLDRRNTKSSVGITSCCREIDLANQFVYEFLSDEMMQLEFSLTRKVIPLHAVVKKHPAVNQDRIIQAQKKIVSKTHFPITPMSKKEFQKQAEKIAYIYEQVYKK